MFRYLKCTFAFFLALGVVSVAGAESDGRGVPGSPQVAPTGSDRMTGSGSSTWEYGPFLNGGVGLGNRSDFSFLSPGFQIGKTLTPVLHAGALSGRFELAGNIMPLWLAFTPAPHSEVVTSNGISYTEQVGGGTFKGLSLTPVIFRWNFANHSSRFKPWVQAAGGVIYTTHKFPPNIEVPKGTPGGTSVFNFSPQGGGGFHYFVKPQRSVDFGINAVHISSASLGDRNPGVNASLQFQLGYTWWK